MADTTTKILSIELQATSAINGIKDLNKQIEVNKARMQELANANQKGSAEYAKLEQHTKALQKAKSTLSRETQNEIKLEYEEKGSLNALRAELSNLTKQYDSLSRAERENINVGGRLKNQINQVTAELKNAEQGTQRYYRNVGNYENALLNTLGINNGFAQSLIGVANSGEGVKGAFNMMGVAAKSFGKTLMALMANPVFLAIAGIAGAGMAFKWFFDYNVECEKALRLTREFTGVAGKELGNLRAEISATASTYGKEYMDVLKAVDAVMAHFHVESAEAIDIINKGFASGADINGDYLALIQQYAPTFHDAGIEADQLVALIQQTRSGIFSKQGLEAIKQGSTRIREMSNSTRQSLTAIGINVDEMMAKLRTGQMTTFDALQQVTAKLREMPDNAQEVGNVMADVFGRQGKFASQEMIESLSDIDTNLDNLIEKSGAYGKAMADNRQATADLEKASADLFGVGENGWETLKTQADTYWKKSLTNVVNWLSNVLTQIAKLGRSSQIFKVAMQVIAGAFAFFTGRIIGIIQAVGAGFKAIGIALKALVETFQSAFDIIGKLGEGLGQIFSGNISQGVATISTSVKSTMKDVIGTIKTAMPDIAKAWGDGFKGVFNFDAVKGAWNAWGDIVDNYGWDSGGFDWITKGLNFNPSNGGGGGNSTNSPTGGKGKGGSNGSSTNSNPKKEVDEEKRRLEALQADLLKKAQELEKKAQEEQDKLTAEGIHKMYERRAKEIRAMYEALPDTEENRKAVQTLVNANYAEMDKALADFAAKHKAEADRAAKQAQEDALKLSQAMMAGTEEGSAAWLQWQLDVLAQQKAAELAIYEGNEQMKAAIVAKYAQQETEARRQAAQSQMEIEQTKYNAIATITGGLGELFGAFGDDQKEFAVLQKTLALGEIMISQAVAIANAVKAGSFATNPWQMIAQIATSVIAVTTAMAQAFASLNQAKFATGGYIKGAGTGTSDSIPVRVSNGESIMNANTTAMFGGLLSSLNQLGGGVPIQVQQTASSVRGEDMLARAVARGVAMLPAPVVSVEDINRGQRQVQVMTDRATL